MRPSQRRQECVRWSFELPRASSSSSQLERCSPLTRRLRGRAADLLRVEPRHRPAPSIPRAYDLSFTLDEQQRRERLGYDRKHCGGTHSETVISEPDGQDGGAPGRAPSRITTPLRTWARAAIAVSYDLPPLGPGFPAMGYRTPDRAPVSVYVIPYWPGCDLKRRTYLGKAARSGQLRLCVADCVSAAHAYTRSAWRAADGQVEQSRPCSAKSATASRSTPKATQPVCATSPVSVRISHVVPKWSR